MLVIASRIPGGPVLYTEALKTQPVEEKPITFTFFLPSKCNKLLYYHSLIFYFFSLLHASLDLNL